MNRRGLLCLADALTWLTSIELYICWYKFLAKVPLPCILNYLQRVHFIESCDHKLVQFIHATLCFLCNLLYITLWLLDLRLAINRISHYLLETIALIHIPSGIPYFSRTASDVHNSVYPCSVCSECKNPVAALTPQYPEIRDLTRNKRQDHAIQ